MIRAACFGLAFGLASSCLAAEPVEAVAPTGAVELFNGKDFTGWTFFMRAGANPAETWSVEDGVIKCTGQLAGYLRSEQGYRDYKLTVEWRFTKPGNTGILVHINGPDKVWPLCIECQGQNGKQGDFWLQGGATCKGHETRETRHVPMSGPSNEKPLGEWNTFEVVCAGNNVKTYVNGKPMNEAAECSVSSGTIGVQSEGAGFEVRKIAIEPLPST
jgi:hypothetical protein